jgi:redox-sensing transcriptional repressor
VPIRKDRTLAPNQTQKVSIPSATISRLVTYLRILTTLEENGINRTSSEDLAEEAQVSAFQVRKDLAYFGRFGTRGMGYTVLTLRRELRRILGLNRKWNAVIIGMGRLGQAIADFPGFSAYDFELRGLFDVDPDKIGMRMHDLTIQHPDELERVVREQGVDMGFITVPVEKAQEAANLLVAAGVKGILNFAPTVLELPDDVVVEPVDFLAGMKRLAFYILNPHLKETKEEDR